MHRLQELVRLPWMGVGARQVTALLKMRPNTDRRSVLGFDVADKFDKTLLLALEKTVPGLRTGRELVSLLVGDNDAALERAVVEDVQDAVLRLECEIKALAAELEAQGKELADIRAIQKQGLLRDMLADLVEARTQERRSALIVTTARQFDSRLSEAARRYWKNLALSLDDGEMELVRLCVDGSLFLPERAGWVLHSRQELGEFVATLKELVGSRLSELGGICAETVDALLARIPEDDAIRPHLEIHGIACVRRVSKSDALALRQLGGALLSRDTPRLSHRRDVGFSDGSKTSLGDVMCLSNVGKELADFITSVATSPDHRGARPT